MGVHPVLVERLRTELNVTVPTRVQSTSFHPFLEGRDLTIGSETGSGKTLAYLLPLMHDILVQRERSSGQGETPPTTVYDYARALILVPNKELVNQVVRMALPLAGGPGALMTSTAATTATATLTTKTTTASTRNDEDGGFDSIIRIAVLPGGLDDPDDFRPFRDAFRIGSKPPDLLVSTPAVVSAWGSKPRLLDFFADLRTLVVDEADMCVDGGYIRDVEQVLLGFRRADRLLHASWNNDNDNNESSSPSSSSSLLQLSAPRKTQHAFVAATIPDYGLRSVSAWLSKRFPSAYRIEMDDLHLARHSGLTRPTEWVLLEGKKERMQSLVRLLKDELKDEKVMVFCNSVDDADGAAQALQRSGFANAVPYHAKLGLKDRAESLEKFRAYHPPRDGGSDVGGDSGSGNDGPVVLVCTDLASRGLDISGVTAVVQLQFAGNAVAHLHRMGRCGRSSTRAGRGIVFYGAQESELVRVLREAEQRQEQSSLRLSGDVSDERLWKEDEDEADEDPAMANKPIHEKDERGTVRKAFSRKRGFTKKRKKFSRSSEP
jgi:superfamily II DNA/RNA helicase